MLLLFSCCHNIICNENFLCVDMYLCVFVGRHLFVNKRKCIIPNIRPNLIKFLKQVDCFNKDAMPQLTDNILITIKCKYVILLSVFAKT